MNDDNHPSKISFYATFWQKPMPIFAIYLGVNPFQFSPNILWVHVHNWHFLEIDGSVDQIFAHFCQRRMGPIAAAQPRGIANGTSTCFGGNLQLAIFIPLFNSI